MRPGRHAVSFAALGAALAHSSVAVPAAAPARVNVQTDVIQTSGGELRIRPLFHGSVMFEFAGKTIHIDPWSAADYAGLPSADVILITHTHADHLDRAMVDRLHKPDTAIVGPEAVIDTLNCAPGCGEVHAVNAGEAETVRGVRFEGVAMYNLVNGPVPATPWHHKGVGAGYVLTFGTTRVFVSGDTECVPEIKALKGIDVAFLAMNPPRTMSPLEAAACAKAFRPKLAYPYHYRGAKPPEFAEALKGVAGVEVRLRNLEGEP